MPKINASKIIEGDVITKSGLTETIDEVERIDFVIDQDNIREEGLDRRSFENECWAGSYANMVNGSTSNGLRRSDVWKRPYFEAANLTNSTQTNYPEMRLDWDSETDSHLVVRCSFFVYSNETGYKFWRNHDFWDFGLVVVPPSAPSYTTSDMITGPCADDDIARVWPYQRVQLNYPFSKGRGDGYLSRSESAIFPKNDDATKDKYPSYFWHQVEKLFDDSQAGKQVLEWGGNSFDLFYPRGAWNQYAVNRSSNLNQSITLIEHCTSIKEAQDGNTFQGAHRFKGSGRVVIYPVFRSYLGDYTGYGATSMDNPGSPYLKMDGITMSYTVYKR